MFSSTEAVDPALLEGGGKVEVWRIDGSAKTLVPKGDIGKFYSGDCYIVLYTYHLGEKKEYYLCCWIGEDCNEDDPNMAAQLASSISNSCKGRPVQVCINQGKEPPQFVAIFQLIVVLKGGLSSGDKKFVTDNGVNDETYTAECVALIRISETAVRDNTAVQVDAVATSLNSNECFFLQSGSSIFTWHGNQSTHERQQLAAEVAELLKPGVSVKHFKEGTESSAFWLALGGKQSYISKKVPQVIVRDSTKATGLWLYIYIYIYIYITSPVKSNSTRLTKRDHVKGRLDFDGSDDPLGMEKPVVDGSNGSDGNDGNSTSESQSDDDFFGIDLPSLDFSISEFWPASYELYKHGFSLSGPVQDSGNGYSGTNQVLSEYSSTVTEVFSEKDMNKLVKSTTKTIKILSPGLLVQVKDARATSG